MVQSVVQQTLERVREEVVVAAPVESLHGGFDGGVGVEGAAASVGVAGGRVGVVVGLVEVGVGELKLFADRDLLCGK